MTGDLLQWLNLVVRWLHVVAGIMWLGQTYLFNRLERNLRAHSTDPNDMGALWMVHGGGFFHLTKLRVPDPLPERLHWFKWESAVTAATGLVLLVVVYYAGGLLLESGAPISEGWAIALGIGSLIAAWVVYNLIWETPLGRLPVAAALVSLVTIVAAAWLLSRVLSGRATYIHIGAMFGTIMVTNVWARILPAQNQMLRALAAGEEVNLALSDRGARCSQHNTYLSVPLIFLMLSNHFPTLSYGTNGAWLVVGGYVLVGWAAAKVLRERL